MSPRQEKKRKKKVTNMKGTDKSHGKEHGEGEIEVEDSKH
jgi:hypothetical protein